MPGPRPTYQPAFSPEDVAALGQLVRKQTFAHRPVQRAKLALLLQTRPAIANPVAAQHLGQHANWVRYWRKRWATDGFSLAALADRPRSGRPAVFSPSGAGNGEGCGL